jgi:4-hydroxythreonine-4-phosphate dehydrogenase
MEEASRVAGGDIRFRAVRAVPEAQYRWPQIDVLQPQNLRVERVPRGQVDAAMGHAAALCLRTAVDLATRGECHGVLFAPLNKEGFHRAGYDYADELAYLADLTDSGNAFILGAMGRIYTVAVTEHVRFRSIPDLITKSRVLGRIRSLNDALRQTGLLRPRIGVAALNVHAGDGGLFGREEIDEIAPAIDEATGEGIDAQGPVPADIVFVRALAGDFDGVVCMYHDQANIARKLQPRRSSATVLMGLPVACATTAHGTAYDIAGKGVADVGSLRFALECVVALSSE